MFVCVFRSLALGVAKNRLVSFYIYIILQAFHISISMQQGAETPLVY